MGLYKNVASQKIAVYAYDTSADGPKTGDAANITAQISKDFGAAAATNDMNPTELDATDHPGVYVFDLTQAETSADNIIITAVSATANIVLDPVQVFTVPPNFRALGIESDGHAHADLKEFLGVAPNAMQSGRIDAYLAAAGLQTDAVEELRNAITGGAYPLSTDANGMVRHVVGTGSGEFDSLSGTVLLRAATQASIDAIEADSNEIQGDLTNGGRLDLIFDAILADTNELLGDLEDGGRLDLIFDAILADTVELLADYEGGWTWVGGPLCTFASSGNTVGVNGTIRNPSINWQDAHEIATSREVRGIKVLQGRWNSNPVDVSNLEMNFTTAPTNFIIDLNGTGWEFPNAAQGVTRTIFRNGRLQAKTGETLRFVSTTGGVRFENMVLVSSLEWEGRFSDVYDTGIAGQWTFLTSSQALSMRFIRCYPLNSQGIAFFDMGGQDGDCSWLDWTGNAEVYNATDAALNMRWYSSAGGILKIFNSCTAGNIYVSGMKVVAEDGSAWVNGVGKPTVTLVSATEAAVALALATYDVATDADIDSAITSYFGTAGDALTDLRAMITGGNYDLNTDANGSIRYVDGTGLGELDATSGLVKIAGTLQTLDDLENLSADGVWDEAVDGAYTARQSLRIQNAASAGKLSGAGTPTVTIRDINDTVDRIVASVDGSGNRTAVTLSV